MDERIGNNRAFVAAAVSQYDITHNKQVYCVSIYGTTAPQEQAA